MQAISVNTAASVQNVQGFHRVPSGKPAETAGAKAEMRDSAMFSDEALRMSDLAASARTSIGDSVRFDLVNRVKAEIAAGIYDTSEKMDIAIERMASRIF